MTAVNWDHIVHYINDLDEAVRTFKDHGLIAFKGGSHKEWGTYNALSYFGLTYIEFLSLEDRELAERIDSPNVVVRDALTTLPDHEVMSRVALRTEDIEATADRLKSHGLELSPILDGKRLDTRGHLIEWRMFTIAGDFQGLAYPFVIQWKGGDAHRLEDLTRSGIIRQHPAGDVEIRSAVFTVSDPSAVAAHWQILFGLSVAGTDAGHGVELSIGDKSFLFKQGDAERLTQLIFHTEAPDLKGKIVAVGVGEYVFA